VLAVVPGLKPPLSINYKLDQRHAAQQMGQAITLARPRRMPFKLLAG
jgi:hypothetical protein